MKRNSAAWVPTIFEGLRTHSAALVSQSLAPPAGGLFLLPKEFLEFAGFLDQLFLGPGLLCEGLRLLGHRFHHLVGQFALGAGLQNLPGGQVALGLGDFARIELALLGLLHHLPADLHVPAALAAFG